MSDDADNIARYGLLMQQLAMARAEFVGVPRTVRGKRGGAPSMPLEVHVPRKTMGSALAEEGGPEIAIVATSLGDGSEEDRDGEGSGAGGYVPPRLANPADVIMQMIVPFCDSEGAGRNGAKKIQLASPISQLKGDSLQGETPEGESKRSESLEGELLKGESLEEELRSVLRDNDRLAFELQNARYQESMGMERLKMFRSAHSRRQQALSEQVSRAEEEVRKVEEERDILRSELDSLRECLVNERLRFANERREDQVRHAFAVSEERRALETEISVLKEEISRLYSRMPEPTHRIERVEEPNSIRSEAKDDGNPGSSARLAGGGHSGCKEQGRLHLVWKRMRPNRRCEV